MKVSHQTSATATGGRWGASKLDDGSFEINSLPPNNNEDGLNPEQLSALGYCACFATAMQLVAHRMELALSACSTTVEGGMQKLEGRGVGLEAGPYANIAGLSEPEAHSVLNATNKVCFLFQIFARQRRG
ncbi:OsmC family protein [Ruegeria litorea]|uniref:OsmC family protein n=1 Tax=Falsiruegeria litorea TaxID=1280831 RepID=A0ABS5WW09_9RHOB|nr:OsmC family protein [Falsiruegeria litorea]MBT8168639.1 OsmC family protein [Falsiruegeria litorea]